MYKSRRESVEGQVHMERKSLCIYFVSDEFTAQHKTESPFSGFARSFSVRFIMYYVFFAIFVVPLLAIDCPKREYYGNSCTASSALPRILEDGFPGDHWNEPTVELGCFGRTRTIFLEDYKVLSSHGFWVSNISNCLHKTCNFYCKMQDSVPARPPAYCQVSNMWLTGAYNLFNDSTLVQSFPGVTVSEKVTKSDIVVQTSVIATSAWHLAYYHLFFDSLTSVVHLFPYLRANQNVKLILNIPDSQLNAPEEYFPWGLLKILGIEKFQVVNHKFNMFDKKTNPAIFLKDAILQCGPKLPDHIMVLRKELHDALYDLPYGANGTIILLNRCVRRN